MVAVVRGRVAGLATAEVFDDGERAEVAFLVSDEDRGHVSASCCCSSTSRRWGARTG